jgi:putative ABC transport system permease protein
MKQPRTIWNRIRSLWLRRDVKREIDEELRFHLEQRTAENVADGMLPNEAALEARKRFGNVQNVREECREARSAAWGETLFQDLRFGARMLAKRPGFTTMAVLSLAIGIGVNSTIFSALNVLFLRPVGFQDPATIVRVESPSFCYPDYEVLKDQCRSLAGLVAVSRHVQIIRGSDKVEMLITEIVSPNYFTVLGIHAAAGSVFAGNDPRLQNDEPVVVISHGLWQRRFGGDPAIVGKTIALLEGAYTILGVAQRDYHGTVAAAKVDMWFVARHYARENREMAGFELLGRRTPGTALAGTCAEVKAIAGGLLPKNPMTGLPPQVTVLSQDESDANHGGKFALFAMAIVGLVLLVACANVSGMLLARNEERRHEMAVRMAVGAGRGRLVRQLLAESLLLAVLGGVLGLWFTVWASSAMLALIPSNLQVFFPEMRIDRCVLAVTLVLTLAAAVVFGLAPAWRAASADLASILKGEATPGSNHWARLRGRDVLVVGQLVVAVVFLVTAMLLVRAFVRGNATDLGFERKTMLHVLIPGIAEHNERDLLERMRAIPGVIQTSLALRPPLALSGGGAEVKVFLPGDATADNGDGRRLGFNVVAPNYFQMMGIRLLRGRTFTEQDTASQAPVVMISDVMARRCWPGEDPIGKVVRVGNPQARPAEIVGVVRDVVRNQIGETSQPFLYLPLSRGLGEATLLLETKGDAAAVLGQVRRELRVFHPAMEPLMVDTQEQVIRVALLPQWLAAWLFGVLGLLAFAMAAAGLYGIVAYSVARRTQEIGIRMALGAQAGDTMRLILRQGLVLALAGLAIGLPLAFGVGWVLRSALYGFDPVDPAVFLGAAVLITAVVLLASYFPARRAARINPMEALRCE